MSIRSLIAATIALAAFGAQASDAYPTRSICLLVPFAAGGAIDLMARPTARKLHELLGQSVVVENGPYRRQHPLIAVFLTTKSRL